MQKPTIRNRIAQYFFGYDAFTVSGSLVEDRGQNDMLADYFGLSPKFESVVAPRPSISYTLATFDWFVGLSQFLFPRHSARWFNNVESMS